MIKISVNPEIRFAHILPIEKCTTVISTCQPEALEFFGDADGSGILFETDSEKVIVYLGHQIIQKLYFLSEQYKKK